MIQEMAVWGKTNIVEMQKLFDGWKPREFLWFILLKVLQIFSKIPHFFIILSGIDSIYNQIFILVHNKYIKLS